jgi:DNA polymerase-3 subunit delta
VSEEAREFAVARFSLKRSPLEEVLAQARILPMLSPRQVVVVTDIDALTEAGLSALEDYLAVPVDSTVLVFEAARLDRRTRAARLLLDRCEVHEAESPDDWGAVAAAARMADGLGVRLDRETAEELVFALGNDQGRLHGELRKLRAYAGPEAQVAPADVAAIVSSARQFSVFELADLLAERRRSDALARLRRLLEAGENPIGIVGLLAWLYRQLLVAQGMPKNTPVWKAAQALRAPRSRVEALVRQAQRFSRQQLSAGLAALCEADVSPARG